MKGTIISKTPTEEIIEVRYQLDKEPLQCKYQGCQIIEGNIDESLKLKLSDLSFLQWYKINFNEEKYKSIPLGCK